MQAYKCDICGNLYEKKNSITIKPSKCPCYIEKNDGYRTCYVDICPDCIAAIQRVIDERSKERR